MLQVRKSLFLFLSIAFIAVLNLNIFGQNVTEFKEVDKFKLSDYNVKVYFKDPLLELIKTYPDFDGKENQIKHKLLSDYLFHNSLYIFQISKKKKVQKNYELFGNPQKLRKRNYFNLNVLKPDGTLEKSIDKVNLGGRFFEHMVLFQSERGKQAVGKGVQIWGYFDKIEPYETFKNRITDLIKMDIENSISDDLLEKKMAPIEPLFDYQKFGLSHVKGRKLTVTVLQYDSLGNVENKYPRIESDENLYLSSTSKELIWVMAFPFFSAQDSSIQNENRIKISSKLENINHYLKDINVMINPTTKQVERILGKLIIHSYSSEGHSTSDVLYQAEFAAIGEFTLPKTIKYCALDDKEFKRPTLTIEVEYELK
ncbi:hypothetical protein [Pedobacter alluvionis]|uniref:Uncharacterized protein n=1 Tax=Pedobacter alluvionis TaxID=475253 RepID=A0A497XYM6_9SPHI|nr:hypothetical protein [Pedobacter alluvionis]RLJ72605.1 hypothetical protein BCL90_4233 [Pedobacter alluvionis]